MFDYVDLETGELLSLSLIDMIGEFENSISNFLDLYNYEI
jgi:hypothetical protein